jgi:AcrR family transcriptional regulator
MATSTSTRDRILDQAMRLFGEHGYKGTSVVEIERAVGLTPGAGGIYHHFRSKESLLTAGIERELSRLDALRDIRKILSGLGDLRVELSVTARYFLAELDSQVELLRIMVSEARLRPTLLRDAMNILITRTYEDFAEWLRTEGGRDLSEEQSTAIATLALGSLLSTRLVEGVLGLESLSVPDDDLIAAWVPMVVALVGPETS